MSFQVESLHLYSHDGRIRSLAFRLGGLSIVTGRSETGKTAILSILDYCLGAGTYRIPIGEIHNRCAWFAALYRRGDETLFVARPRLPSGQKVHTGVCIRLGSVSPPPFDELRINANVDTLISVLGSFARIGEAITQPEPGRTTDPISPSIKHARDLILQPQSLLGSPSQLFYGTEDSFEKLHLRDTLPYFLGAVPEDFARKRARLRDARHELKGISLAEDNRASVRRHAIRSVGALVVEARDAGIDVDAVDPPTTESAIRTLSTISSWSEARDEPRPGISDELSELQREFNALSEEADSLRRQIDAAELFSIRTVAFSEEAARQDARLSLVPLFGDDGLSESQCPLCKSELPGEYAAIEAIQASLQRLRRNMESAERQHPVLTQHLDGLRRRLAEVQVRADELRSGIRSIYRSRTETQAYQDAVLRRARISGRASEMLGSFSQPTATDAGLNRRRALEREVARLEKECDTEVIADKMKAIEIAISSGTANHAKNMGLAHTDSPVTLDLKELALRFVVGMDIVGLERIGAGKNWVGYHVAAHLALHHWLVVNDRPVPRVIVFDQVSLPFFSNESVQDPNRSERDLRDDDRAQVMRIVRELSAFCESHSGRVQIILAEHVDSDEPWFVESRIAQWRGELALVPADWPVS